MDKDGYPEDHELKKIREWPYEDGWHDLLEYIQDRWRHPDYFHRKGNTYWLSTAGWSGNESLIGALEQNRPFWAICWVSSKRGGHDKFRVIKLKNT